MRKNTNSKRQFKSILTRCACAVLTLVLLVQTMAFGISAAAGELGSAFGSSSSGSSSTGGGYSGFDTNEIAQALRDDIIKSMKQDLLQRVEDYDLSGEVDIILTFSEGSLIDEYTNKYADKMTYEEFKVSKEAAAYERKLEKGRAKAIEQLLDSGLVDEVKHTYSHILDGESKSFSTTVFGDGTSSRSHA